MLMGTRFYAPKKLVLVLLLFNLQFHGVLPSSSSKLAAASKNSNASRTSGVSKTSSTSKLDRTSTSKSFLSSFSFGSSTAPNPYKDHCLRKLGFFSSAVPPNAECNRIFPVSEAGRAECCGTHVTCLWSEALESHLEQVLGKYQSSTFHAGFRLGRGNALLKVIRLRKKHFKLTYHDYERVTRLVTSRRAAWDEARPDLPVDWTRKRPTIVANSSGLRWLRPIDLTVDDTEEHRRAYDEVIPEIREYPWSYYKNKKLY